MSSITSVNGHQVYAVTKNDIKDYKPSAFVQAYETWEEGSPKSKLSEDELRTLQSKYDANKMSEDEVIHFFGDLVEAGILSKSNALAIYNGAAPLDVSNYDGTSKGTLQKADNHESYATGSGFINRQEGQDKGYDYYKSALEGIKKLTNANQEDSPYFNQYNGFLEVMEQLRRDQITKSY